MKRRNPSSKMDSSSLTHSQSLGASANKANISTTAQHRMNGEADAMKVSEIEEKQNDRFNYAILVALYTLQGIPMGLSASIPFLIQQKMKYLATLPAAAGAEIVGQTVASNAAAAARLSYNANAIFALCSWPFSLKLLWAPIVDACFFKSIGRRKSWLVPVQGLAGLLMISGASYVERQLGLGKVGVDAAASFTGGINVKGVTAFFFALYFLMATQDIAVDGWALTMLSKRNRGRGPVCNSIGQNIGYFLSFVGFLALNDAESCETIWRPLFRLPSNPGVGMVSLGGFIRFMGYFMLVTTTLVGILKKEETSTHQSNNQNDELPRSSQVLLNADRLTLENEEDEDKELDASEVGLKETYHRLWEVCKLPSVRWLFLILLTYRLPCALSDNVKFLKAVELGLSKSTTALLSPTVILPLGILVPLVATKVWHGHPLRQFMLGFKLRVTLVPILDLLMLSVLRKGRSGTTSGLVLFWVAVVSSTAMQAIVNSMQFNAQMTFFASRVDPAIGGTYMTLLNTAANLGSTWPASAVMWLTGKLTKDPECLTDVATGIETCSPGRDPYTVLQIGFALMGLLWIRLLGRRVDRLATLPDEAWRTKLLDETHVADVEKDQ